MSVRLTPRGFARRVLHATLLLVLLGAFLQVAHLPGVGDLATPAEAQTTATIEVCKQTTLGVTGTFTFTITGTTNPIPPFSVPAGVCTGPISVTATTNFSVTVTEQLVPGSTPTLCQFFRITTIVVFSSSPCPTGVFNILIAPGGDTVVIFTDSGGTAPPAPLEALAPPNQGFVKICKVAGPGVAVGTPYTFTVNGTSLVVPAGPAALGGYCLPFPAFLVQGSILLPVFLPVGTAVSVQETIPAGQQVGAISITGATGVTTNPAAGTASFSVGNDINLVTFTDQVPSPTPTATPTSTPTATPTVTGGATPTVTLTPTGTACILGDINCDGIVDIRDYGIWRQNFGQGNCGNSADLNTDCLVDIRDYGIWRTNFGHTSGAAARTATPVAAPRLGTATPLPIAGRPPPSGKSGSGWDAIREAVQALGSILTNGMMLSVTGRVQ